MSGSSPPRFSLSQALRSSLHLVRRLLEEIGHDDLAGVAAQMTYYFMLALLPLMILSVAFLQALPWEVDIRALSPEFLSAFSPEAAEKISQGVRSFLADRPSGGVVLWILPVLWAASRATGGARKGLNRVFRCRPQRNVVVLRLADLGLTVAALLLVLLSNALLVGGRELGQWLVAAFHLPHAFMGFWALLRWPVAFASMVGILMLAYRVLPSRRTAWRHLLLGAVPAVVGWILLSSVFRLWVKLLGGFDKLYGGMATFFVLMFLLWLISLVMLLGGEIAARSAERSERRRQAAAAAPEPAPPIQ
ncbi:MAG: YihY/virulence factor BrkB family protein [Planctomycetota bacterium]|nr:MAG: YihY/virulence factor BrkB family protein [Planctomycetota bacterium]